MGCNEIQTWGGQNCMELVGGRGVLTMPEAAAPPSSPLRAHAVGTMPVKDRDDDMSPDQLIGIR